MMELPTAGIDVLKPVCWCIQIYRGRTDDWQPIWETSYCPEHLKEALKKAAAEKELRRIAKKARRLERVRLALRSDAVSK